MSIEQRKIDIKSSRRDSGWIVEITKKRKYFYISSKEYFLPFDLEKKLHTFFDLQAEKIQELFNVNISVFMGNQKFDSKEQAIEFIDYIFFLIRSESDLPT